MYNSRFLLFAAFMIVAIAMGCSGGGETPYTPAEDIKVAVESEGGTTACLGLWNVVIDKATGQIDVADLRTSENIINVLGFLEPPALTGMTIDFGTLSIADPEIQVDVVLTHPIPDATFMGFDVRGVVFGPKVTNADGLTVIPSPEFFKGVPFGYQNGLLGTPDSVAHYKGLAGYKYFCDGLGANDDLVTFMSDPANLARRGVFTENPTQNRRHYILNWTGTTHAFFTFNYAIYANYDWPIGEAPIDVDDFFITTANSQEAFCANVTEVSNSTWYLGGMGGGGFSIDAEIWDWQGNINSVVFWSPDLSFTAESPATFVGPGTTPYSYVYNCAKPAVIPKKLGPATIFVKAIDTKTFGQSWLMGLLPPSKTMYGKKIYNAFTCSIEVGEGCPSPPVTGITPVKADTGKILNNVQIFGTFLDGLSLAAKLTKSGSSDIIGTDITFKDNTKITADLDLTGAEVGFWDVVVTNGCGTDGTGVGLFEVTCPVTKVTGFSPGMGSPGDFLDDAEIIGTIADGTQLAAKLSKSGSSDIIGTDVNFVDGTKITADFDLTGAAIGLWDVVVTNGCGNEGTGAELFKVALIIYYTSFESSEGESPNWSRDATYWHCHWFDNGTINVRESTCSEYGWTGGNWYAWRTNGITIPPWWTGSINLRLNHLVQVQEPGYWDNAGVQYSLDGWNWYELDFYDHPYDSWAGYWQNFSQRDSNADLTPLVSPGGTIWIRFDLWTLDGIGNSAEGWTIFEMAVTN